MNKIEKKKYMNKMFRESILNNKNLSELVLEHNDYPMLHVPVYALFLMNKPLIKWKDIPNILDERYKLR